MKTTIHLLFALLASATVQAQTPHPWQMFHHDQQHAGYANVKGPQSNSLKWKYNLGKVGMEGGNSVAISRTGGIYVTGPNKITKLNRAGALQWSKPYMGAQGPCISNDGKRIYFVSGKSLVCMDTLGNQNWAFTATDTMIFGATLSANDSVLYVGCWNKYVYAVNAITGAMKWQYLTYGSVSYAPTIGTDGTIIVGGGDAHRDSDSTVYGINPNGTTKWTYITAATGGAHCGSPAIGPDGLVYEPAQPTVYVLDNNGSLHWQDGNFTTEVSGIITPAITPDTTIYAGSNKGVVTCIDGSVSGHPHKWTYQTGADPLQSNFYGIIAFPVVDNEGSVFIGSVDNKVHAVDKNGAVKWTYLTGGRISEASPALDIDGTLYISSADGWLYAFYDPGSASIASLNNINIQAEIYPNPATNELQVAVNGYTGVKQITIYNAVGQKIFEISTSNESTHISTENFARGVYVVEVKGVVSEFVQRRKLVVE